MGTAPSEPAVTHVVGHRRVRIHVGDILDCGPVDAIVSSDDNWLTHGGGVSRRIWEVAGEHTLQEATQDRVPLNLCDVLPSTPGKLDTKHLLHAITIDFDSNRRLSSASAVLLYQNLIDQANSLGAETVALPILGSGAGQLSIEGSVQSLLEAIESRDGLRGAPKELVVAIWQPSEETLSSVQSMLAERQSATENIDELIVLTSLLAGDRGTELAKAWVDANHEDPHRRLFSALKALETIVWILIEQAEPAPEAAPARAGLGNLYATAVAAWAQSDTPFPRELKVKFEHAIAVRNRAAHGAVDAGDAHIPILAAISDAATFLVMNSTAEKIEALRAETEQAHDGDWTTALSVGVLGAIAPTLGVGALAGAAVGLWAHRRKANQARSDEKQSTEKQTTPSPKTSVETTAEKTSAAPSDLYSDGTRHIHQLRRFLKETLDSGGLEDLLTRAREKGYRGDDDYVLLEFCVRVTDPIGLLVDEYTVRRLRRILAKQTGEHVDNSCSSSELAATLLRRMGFPTPVVPKGLSTAQKSLETARFNVARHNESSAIRGTVVEFSTTLEYLLRILLHFVCMEVFTQPPEIVLGRYGLLDVKTDLNKQSLGSLFSLTERLGKKLANDADLEDRARERLEMLDIDIRKMCPANWSQVVGERNLLSHWDRTRGALQGDIESVRKTARDFFENANRLLSYYHGGDNPSDRLFPHVIAIEKVEIDRWGRRLITAQSDSGRQETLFTSRKVKPGEVYFMHPLSNPVRVDPVLVQAGDLVNPEAGKA